MNAASKLAAEIGGNPALEASLQVIVESYRHWHQFDRDRPSAAKVRAALTTFQKHASALSQWIDAANPADLSSAHRDAMTKMDVAARGTGPDVAQWMALRGWLGEQNIAADTAKALLPARGHYHSAARHCAAQLLAVFERHGIKTTVGLSVSGASLSVRALIAIARSAGDRTLHPAAAKKVLTAVRTLSKEKRAD